jgi:hypothetical protein
MPLSPFFRFDITPKGQQVHIALGPKEAESPRHPCFRLESLEALTKLQQKIWEHYQRGDASAPRAADKPGVENSGETVFFSFDCIAISADGMKRIESRWISTKILRQRLCRQSPRIQFVT